MITNKPTSPAIKSTKGRPMPVAEECVNCKFWNPKELGDNPLVGNCRRFPHVEPVRKFHTDWCGEWKPKS